MYICQLVWKKINQEITVVYNQFLYWHKQKKWEALPPRRISKKKNWNYKSLPEPTLWNEKIEKKSYPYVHIFIFSV